MNFRSRGSWFCRICVPVLVLTVVPTFAQRRDGVPAVPAPVNQVVLNTAEVPRIRVVPVASGLSRPWGIAFRGNGDILVTERDTGALRVVRDGKLLDKSVPGVPEVFSEPDRAGLMDIALHPNDDRVVYLTYSKSIERDGTQGWTVALARGRLEGGALTEVRDIFVAEGLDLAIAASRVIFAEDGSLFMTVGGSFVFHETGPYAQDPGSHFGKLLRLNDDGTAADGNPFSNNSNYLPEIYSMGHRNQLGLAFHPETGDLWATENGPQGGDEANIIRAGANYGWPVVSFSREYSGVPVSKTPWGPEFESPEVLWWPSIAPSGLTFYTGEHFPAWQGNLFVGSMMVGRMDRTGHLERIVFNRMGQEVRREWLLTELKQRIRDVRQGPDGYLYVLTDEDDAVLLRIEPAHAIPDPPGNILTIRRPTAPRVSPVHESDWTAEQHVRVANYAPDGLADNALRTLIRVPALVDRIYPLLTYIANDSTLSRRHRILLILRTTWLTQSANLWATYASQADEVGLTDEELLSVAEGPGNGLGEFEDVLLGLADQLFRDSAVTDRTWELLSSEYTQENLLDAVVTVSEINAQAIVFNSLGIQPDPHPATSWMPATSVAYNVVAPDREASLTKPRVDPVDGDGLRVTRTLRRHPDLADSWYENPWYIGDPELSRLTPHDRELLILRIGWNSQSVYEWAKHVGSVGRARDHGLDPIRIAQGADASGWSETELTLIKATDEMYRDSVISDETWDVLSQHYDTHQMMSIVWTVARYRRVSMMLNALGVQTLPEDEGLPVLEGY